MFSSVLGKILLRSDLPRTQVSGVRLSGLREKPMRPTILAMFLTFYPLAAGMSTDRVGGVGGPDEAVSDVVC